MSTNLSATGEKSADTGIEIRMARKQDLMLVRELALLIFPVTYQGIVEAVQIDYMMDLFYTPENLVSQFESGQNFLIIYTDGNPSGYASYTRLSTEGDF